MLQTSIRIAVLACLSSVLTIAFAADKSAAIATGWCVTDHRAMNTDANQACEPNLSGNQQSQSELPLLLAQATTEQTQEAADVQSEENTDLTASPSNAADESIEVVASEADTEASETEIGALLQGLKAKLGSLSQDMLAALILGVTIPVVLLLALTTRFFKSEPAVTRESDGDDYRYSDDQTDHDDLPHADAHGYEDTHGYEESASEFTERDSIAAFDSPDEAIYESESDSPEEGDEDVLESLNLIDEVFSDSANKGRPDVDQPSPESSNAAQLQPASSESTSSSQLVAGGVPDPYQTARQNDVNGQDPDLYNRDSSQDLEDLESVEESSSAVDSLYDDFNQTYIEEVPAYHIDLPQEGAAQAPVNSSSSDTLAQSRKAQIAEREKAIHSAHWLSREPVQMQKDYVIDYLVYWMAHADKRFAPAAEKKVLQMKNPGTRDLIKRDVFLNNAYAYSMVIKIVQTQMTLDQRRQILDLLMALLVVEHALTPIQNNLLRFLADAFGVGASGIKSQFERAFGYSMPAIPRPDKLIWWKQINNEHTLRWNARAIARLPEQVRDRILLGQSLDGEIRAASVIQSYKLAEDRCHPGCVDKLGERAQALLKSRSQRFAAARDNLLETIS